jgi:hypothetical protein
LSAYLTHRLRTEHPCLADLDERAAQLGRDVLSLLRGVARVRTDPEPNAEPAELLSLDYRCPHCHATTSFFPTDRPHFSHSNPYLPFFIVNSQWALQQREWTNIFSPFFPFTPQHSHSTIQIT